jgi:Sigma-70, region 4
MTLNQQEGPPRSRARRRGRMDQLDPAESDEGNRNMNLETAALSPEQHTSAAELGRALEDAILAIPERYRIVLVMRDVEQMDTAETAAALELTENNVKVRLHRARALVGKELFARAGPNAQTAFGFMGARCDYVVSKRFSMQSGQGNKAVSGRLDPNHAKRNFVQADFIDRSNMCHGRVLMPSPIVFEVINDWVSLPCDAIIRDRLSYSRSTAANMRSRNTRARYPAWFA